MDLTALTDEVANKVWETMNANAGIEVAPLEEQDDMVKFSLKSQVLPFITVIKPVVEKKAEQTIKDRLIRTINEAHEAGHDDSFTIMAIMAELSDDEE